MESTNQFLKPITTKRNESGNLELGGCDLVELAEKYGTPLYVVDEVTLRSICKDYKQAFSKYEKVNMMFASKALCTMATSKILSQEGFGFDVVSAGEIYTVYNAGVDMSKVLFNGNNKSFDELDLALELGVGRISVDNFLELDLLNEIAKSKNNGEAWFKSLKHKFSEPWSGFRNDVENSLNDVFVSRPPRKSATGEIHQETIRPLNPKHKNYSEKDIKSGIFVRGGLANNGNMLRTDVFAKKNKKGKDEFYLVPIYLSDLGKPLPNKAIVPLKFEDEWLILDETYTFKFSLYMDDLVKVKKGDNEALLGYFCGTDRASGAISLENHDRSQKHRGVGVKKLDVFQKFSVDPLGNIVEIKHEVRLPLTGIKSNTQKFLERKLKKG